MKNTSRPCQALCFFGAFVLQTGLSDPVQANPVQANPVLANPVLANPASTGQVLTISPSKGAQAVDLRPNASASRLEAKKEDVLRQIVIDYVRGARGWMDGSYKVLLDKVDGDTRIYLVDYIDGDTATNLVTGEGQSFRVVVNPVTKKVERELY